MLIHLHEKRQFFKQTLLVQSISCKSLGLTCTGVSQARAFVYASISQHAALAEYSIMCCPSTGLEHCCMSPGRTAEDRTIASHPNLQSVKSLAGCSLQHGKRRKVMRPPTETYFAIGKDVPTSSGLCRGLWRSYCRLFLITLLLVALFLVAWLLEGVLWLRGLSRYFRAAAVEYSVFEHSCGACAISWHHAEVVQCHTHLTLLIKIQEVRGCTCCWLCKMLKF